MVQTSFCNTGWLLKIGNTCSLAPDSHSRLSDICQRTPLVGGTSFRSVSTRDRVLPRSAKTFEAQTGNSLQCACRP